MKKLLASMAMFLTAATSVYAANSPEAIVPPVSGSAAEAGAPINPAGISTSRDAVQMVLELKDKYLRKHNLREGCFKGKCLVAATEIIEQPVGHSDYERYRQIAFKKAEARALAELVREAAVSVSTSMEQSLYEDWSSNAAKFPESGKGRSAAYNLSLRIFTYYCSRSYTYNRITVRRN